MNLSTSNTMTSRASFIEIPLLIQQRKKAFLLLIFVHLLIIASSNYLVQIPITIFGVHNTWGAFTFPFIFLTTDLTVRLFNAPLARKIIFWAMFPGLILSYIISIIFAEGQYQGFAALVQFNTFVGRIALASFIAYCVGQLLDITVFNKLRQNSRWWVAPTASTIIGNLIDALIFFFLAFYQCSDPFMSEHWFNLGLADYCVRIIINMLFFLPLYGVLLNFLLKRLKHIN